MNIPTQDELIERIDRFRERHDGMAPTRFGSDATGDPNLLAELRKGRSPSLAVLNRIADFMAERDRAAGHVASDTAAPAGASPGNAATDSPVEAAHG